MNNLKFPIEISSYNLDEAYLTIVKHLLNNESHLSNKEMSEKLGISERTLYRYMVSNNLNRKLGKNYGKRKLTKQNAISLLEGLGYKISIDSKSEFILEKL